MTITYSTSRRYVLPSATATARTTAQHPQLRDLIACVGDGDVLHLSGKTIETTSFSVPKTRGRRLGSRQSRLPFKANCLIAGQGLLCAGGQNTELSLRSLDEDGRNEDWSSANFSIGGSINNSVYVAPPAVSGSRARLYCSNNDQTISLYDVHGPSAEAYSKPQLLRTDILTLNTAVNAAELSPDGRFAIAVGDSADVFLYDVSISGKHKLVKTMTASRDSGFAVAWSRSSNSFAVASQDGVVSVFDLRQCLDSRSLFATPSTGKLASLLTSNVGPYTGAARALQYSPGSSTELLAFSEQCGIAHVLDARTYDERQAQHLLLPSLPPPAGALSPCSDDEPLGPYDTMPYNIALDQLPPAAGRAIRLAALTPPQPPAPPTEPGPTRRHARRLVTVPRPTSTTMVDASTSTAVLEAAGMPFGWPGLREEDLLAGGGYGAGMPELTGLSWSPDGSKLYIGTETTIAEYSRDHMAQAAFPSASIM